MTTGTTWWTRVNLSSTPDLNIGGEAFKNSERSIRETLQNPFVDPETPHDTAAHRLHRAVHVRVGLEDPAHLAPLLPDPRGGVEVLDVERRGHARVLVLRLDAEEAHAHAVDRARPAQVVPPAERQQPPVHLLEHLVDVRDRDGDRRGLAVGRLGHHEPVAIEHELHLLGPGVQVALREGREAPVVAPGGVVDLGEAVHVAPQRAPRHPPDRDAVARLQLLGELEDHRQHPRAVGDHELPHERVDGLGQPRLLAAGRVVRRVPGLADHRLALEALDQHAALVVDREVHRPDHVVAPVRAQPAARRVQQRRQDVARVLELQEAEHPPAVALELVERVVVLRRDPPHDAPVAHGHEQLRIAVREERVLAAHQEQPALQAQRRHPDPGARVQPVRELDELLPVPSRQDGTHLHAHEARPYMPTVIDVFAKVRGHERSEQLRAARDADLLPYFRRLEGPAGPVVEMEGAERIMLGSNNYLGLTADPRVREAAREALNKYGTGLTGSRLLNGTLDLHLDLERELAEWMGTEEAIVFSTGHQANVGTLGTILAPGDTVIADSADHASILDGC